MGASLSTFMSPRTPAQVTEPRDLLKATGTYYGPNFVLERDGVAPAPNSSRAYWDDIVNLLSGGGTGTIDLQQLRNLGDLYSQLPPAQIKQATTITACYNLQRGSLQLSKMDATIPQYNFEFQFDSTVACYITLYWGVRLEVNAKGDSADLKFVGNQGNTTVKWVFGPFPPGIGQKFTLPSDKIINEKLLSLCDMNWVTELDLNGIVAPNSPNSITIPVESENADSESNSQTQITATLPTDQSPLTFEKNKSTIYHVVIELKTVGNNSERQVTMVRFNPRTDGKIGLEYTKKIAIVKLVNEIENACYTMQEIYGFTDPTGNSESSIIQLT